MSLAFFNRVSGVSSSINIENVKYYSSTAESIDFLLNEEVRYQPLSKIKLKKIKEKKVVRSGAPSVIIMFTVGVAFSAIVLIAIYLFMRLGQRRRKHYLRKRKRSIHERRCGARLSLC